MLFVLAITGGCITDDRTFCPTPTPAAQQSTELQFRQTINEPGTDQIDNIGNIRIYVFNQTTGVLARIIEAGPTDIARRFVQSRFPDGIYSMIAFATGSASMATSGFKDAVFRGTSTDNYTSPVHVGSTTLSDFRMMLDYQNINPVVGNSGEILPKIALDNLYYAAVENVQVLNNRNQVVSFDFLKDFATFNIRMSGLQNLRPVPTAPLNVYITGRNAVYTAGNGIDPNSKLVRYDHHTSETYNGSLQTDLIKTLRLDVNHVVDKPLILYVTQPATPPATGEVNVRDTPINLTSLIMQIEEPAGSGRFPFRSQDPIDRKSEFVIEITFNPTTDGYTVQLSINGFTIGSLTPIT